VWENVPGAFSSNKGHDFRAVLEEISQTEIPMPKDGRWAESGCVEWGGTSSLAWRTLDAQYWGVPQRRKRIFLVADFDGRSAAEILFIEQGLHGDSAESQGEGQEATTDVGTSVDSAVGVDIYNNKITGDKVTALTTNNTSTSTAPKIMTSVDSASICWEMNQPRNRINDYSTKTTSPTLTARMGTGGNQVPIVHLVSDSASTDRVQKQVEDEDL
jgi:DNA (cytosine-5)-methyltransferase 1